jgi:hypothetical protein
LSNVCDLNTLWSIVCEITRDSQVSDGSTMNPVVKAKYYRETAFSASILATNSVINNNSEDRVIAEKNFAYVTERLNRVGVVFDEPIWTPRGESLRKGSLPATVFLFEALELASKNLSRESQLDIYGKELMGYTEQCLMEDGWYAHDVIDKTSSVKNYAVINTTLMAVLIKFLVTADKSEQLLDMLKSQQHQSGLWPYIVSGIRVERLLDRVAFLVPKANRIKKICVKLFKDRSFFFSDFLHHAVTLQYLLKTTPELNKKSIRLIRRGYSFIFKNIVEKDNSAALDFSWEPQPQIPRYSNFKDTTTYFVVIDILFLMQERGLITTAEAVSKANKLARHMLDHLCVKNRASGEITFLPYEGTNQEIDLIFPRPAESIFHKGHLMCNMIMLSNSLSNSSGFGIK